jgi:hypothetical protein
MRTLAAVILTLAPVLTALGASGIPAVMRDLSPRGRYLVDRQVSVHKKALPDGRLRLSFEHSPLRSQGFSVDEARPLLTLHDRSLSWEKQLHEEYLAKYGTPTVHLPEALENSRQVMALRLSTRFMGAGFRDAARELFNDPLVMVASYGLGKALPGVHMRIDPTKTEGARIFRTWGWLVAIVVSQDIKEALEQEHVTGARFIPV